MDKCFLCKSKKRDEIKYGEFMTRGDISVHYFCLLLTSNLMQKGRDDEGFLGFLVKDIKAEAKRVSSAVCCYCKKLSANISCCAMKCRKAFHLSCGLENNAENQFVGTFKSYCDRHVNGKKRMRTPAPNESCCICYDDLIGSEGRFNYVTMLQAPCCKNGWFHKWCLAEFAKTAGYFFKCPLCNDNKEFRKRLVCKGIFIPDRDAAWELEPNAFAELLERPQECSAVVCNSKGGRATDNNRNKLIICSTCGSVAIHRLCMTIQMDYFYCDECSPIIATQHSASTINISASQQNESDEDEEVDVCGDDNPPTPAVTVHQTQESDDDDEGTVQPRSINKLANRILDDDDMSSDSDVVILVRGRKKQRYRRLSSCDSNSTLPCTTIRDRAPSQDRESFFDSGAETDRSGSSGDKKPHYITAEIQSSVDLPGQGLPNGFKSKCRRYLPLKDVPNENHFIASRTRRRSVCSGTSSQASTNGTQNIPKRRNSTASSVAISSGRNEKSRQQPRDFTYVRQASCQVNHTSNIKTSDPTGTSPIAHRTRRRQSLHASIPTELESQSTSPRRQRTMSEDPSKISPAIQRTRRRSFVESSYSATPLTAVKEFTSNESHIFTPKGKRSRSNSASSICGTNTKKLKSIPSDDENDCNAMSCRTTTKRRMSRGRSPLTANLRDLYAFLTPAYVKNNKAQGKDPSNEDEAVLAGDTLNPNYNRLFNKNKSNIRQTKPSETTKLPKPVEQPYCQTDSSRSNLAQQTFLQSYSILIGANPDNSKPHKSGKPKHRRSHTFSAHNLPSNQTKIETFFKRV